MLLIKHFGLTFFVATCIEICDMQVRCIQYSYNIKVALLYVHNPDPFAAAATEMVQLARIAEVRV